MKKTHAQSMSQQQERRPLFWELWNEVNEMVYAAYTEKTSSYTRAGNV